MRNKEDAKENDMEALLRLCAMKHFVKLKQSVSGYQFTIEGYQSSYEKLLDQFSEESMSFTNSRIEEYKESLTAFLELFQISNKQSSKVALLESFYVVFEKVGIRKPITVKTYNCILNNETYKANVRQGTVKLKSMNERWKTVYEIWSGADH